MLDIENSTNYLKTLESFLALLRTHKKSAEDLVIKYNETHSKSSSNIPKVPVSPQHIPSEEGTSQEEGTSREEGTSPREEESTIEYCNYSNNAGLVEDYSSRSPLGSLVSESDCDTDSDSDSDCHTSDGETNPDSIDVDSSNKVVLATMNANIGNIRSNSVRESLHYLFRCYHWCECSLLVTLAHRSHLMPLICLLLTDCLSRFGDLHHKIITGCSFEQSVGIAAAYISLMREFESEFLYILIGKCNTTRSSTAKDPYESELDLDDTPFQRWETFLRQHLLTTFVESSEDSGDLEEGRQDDEEELVLHEEGVLHEDLVLHRYMPAFALAAVVTFLLALALDQNWSTLFAPPPETWPEWIINGAVRTWSDFLEFGSDLGELLLDQVLHSI